MKTVEEIGLLAVILYLFDKKVWFDNNTWELVKCFKEQEESLE